MVSGRWDKINKKIYLKQEERRMPLMKIVSVGGGGHNIIWEMYEYGMRSAEFLVLNTYKESFHKTPFLPFILLGEKISNWEGTNRNYRLGRKYFFSSKEEVKKELTGKDLIFVVATLGGGTSSGASPEVARLSKELGAFTIAFVSMPFLFEGKMVYNLAKKGLQKLRKHVDAIIVIGNNQIIKLPERYVKKSADINKPFCYAVKCLIDLIFHANYTNIRTEEVFSWLKENFRGFIRIAYGIAKDENEVNMAIEDVLNSPLLETFSVSNAEVVVLNLTINPEKFKENKIGFIKETLLKEVAKDTQILWGVVFDERMEECLRITMLLGRR